MKSISRKSLLTVLVLVAFVGLCAPSLGAASTLAQEGSASDVIVLLDVSQSVLPYFHDITDYVVSSVVRDFLRIGDTFHLLSFGEGTQVEINQRITGEPDIRSVLARLYLLYPLARNTDLISALGYLYQYLVDLPESRSKVVVLITDGVQNPPKNSAYYGLEPDKVNAQLDAIASRIRSNGWPVYIIKVPFSPDRAAAEAKGAVAGQSGAAGPAATQAQADSATATLAQALNTTVTDYAAEEKADVARKSLSLPVAEFPPDLGRKGLNFSFTLRIHNAGDSDISLELQRVLAEGVDILQKKSFLTVPARKSGNMDIHVSLPPDSPSGPTKLPIELYFADGIRVSPSHGVLSFTLAPSPLAKLFRSGSAVLLFALVFAAGLVLVLLAVLFLTRRMPRRAAEPVVAAVRESADRAREREEERKASKAAAGRPAAAASPTAAPALPESRGKAAKIPAPMGSPAPAGVSQASPATASPSEKTGAKAAAGGASGATRETKARETAAPAISTAKSVEAARRQEGAQAQPASPRMVRPGSIQLELRVDGQNPSIGTRNIHLVHAGTAKSVGGDRSDFLVFLMPVPHRSAEIHFDGERCAFVPLRPELFPDIQGSLEDCLGKDITMLSKHGYRMTLRFHKYVAPAERINRLLHCIETPGLFALGDGD